MAPNASKPEDLDEYGYLREAIHKFTKGATTGFSVYAALTVIKALLQARLVKSPKTVLKDVFSLDNIRFSLFIGAYPAVYKLALHILRRKHYKKTDNHYVIAAAIASLTCLLENPDRRKSFAVFLLARAIGGVYNSALKRNNVPPMRHDVTLAFGAATGLVIYAVAMDPTLLPKGYYNAIKAWSRDYSEENLQTLFRNPCDKHIPCESVLHPGQSCLGHGLREFFATLVPSAEVYLPIHLLPFILKYKAIFQSPADEIVSFLTKMARSTMFMSTTGIVMRTCMCLLYTYVRPTPPPVQSYKPYLSGFIGASIGLQFESVNRQGELAMYVAPFALNALYILARRRGILPNVPYGSTMVFTLAMVTIMYVYEKDASSLSRMINNGLAYLCGKPENTPVSKNHGNEKDVIESHSTCVHKT